MRVVRTTTRIGFALLEAIVALAIVAAVGGSALGLMSAQSQAAARIAPALAANELAENRLQTLRLLSTASLRSLPDSLTAGVSPIRGRIFLWRAHVRADDRAPHLFDIRVEVSGAGSAVLESLIYMPGEAPSER